MKSNSAQFTNSLKTQIDFLHCTDCTLQNVCSTEASKDN